MNLRNRLLATAGAVLLVATTAFTGSAQSTTDTGVASVAITADPDANYIAVTVSDSTFSPRAYSFVDQTATGLLSVTVTDSRGTAVGWNVTLSATDFTAGAESFDISNLSLIAGTVSGVAFGGSTASTAGITPSDASPVQETSSSSTEILSAAVGSGTGQFLMPMSGNLNIPGGTLVGTYTSTVTVTIETGP